jgi:serine/threonine-protein kinase SRPK3
MTNFIPLDIHLGNVLLRLPKSLDGMSPEELYKEFGFPKLEPVIRLDKKWLPKGVPKHAIQPVWLGEVSELIPLSDAEILLTDFGLSFLPSTTPRYYSDYCEVGMSLLPPEAYFLPQESLSFPSDIWALACTIWEMISPRPLFMALMCFQTTDHMIKQYVDLLGKLPPEWWQRWDARSKFFNEEGVKIDRITKGPLRDSFEQQFEEKVQRPRRFYKMEEVSEEEKAALLNMLKAMMTFKPGDRMTVKQIVESKWMKEWALPELSRLKKAG